MHQSEDGRQGFFFGILFLSFFGISAGKDGILTKMENIKPAWFFPFVLLSFGTLFQKL
jgi:hypothetical protein